MLWFYSLIRWLERPPGTTVFSFPLRGGETEARCGQLTLRGSGGRPVGRPVSACGLVCVCPRSQGPQAPAVVEKASGGARCPAAWGQQLRRVLERRPVFASFTSSPGKHLLLQDHEGSGCTWTYLPCAPGELCTFPTLLKFLVYILQWAWPGRRCVPRGRNSDAQHPGRLRGLAQVRART